MLRTVLFVVLVMSTILLFFIFLVARFVPDVNGFLFSSPKIECKPCICNPECHCETKCIQQQIMKECNLGVDTHNALASYHTQDNQTTRFILIFSVSINFLLLLLLLFRKPILNCYRAHQRTKQQQQAAQHQAIARQNTEHYTMALQQMVAPSADQGPSNLINPYATSSQPLFQLLSNLNHNNRV
jgi:hypothetical protein